jgi:hypothetical protein
VDEHLGNVGSRYKRRDHQMGDETDIDEFGEQIERSREYARVEGDDTLRDEPLEDDAAATDTAKKKVKDDFRESLASDDNPEAPLTVEDQMADDD